MAAESLYLAAALLLILASLGCWAGNLLMLPGNWGILLVAAIHLWAVPLKLTGRGLSVSTLVVLAVLAGVGEIAEAMAGAAGAAKQGGSRRGLALSLVGAACGSIVGAAVGLPIPLPVVGSAVGAVLGGAMGAFGGAMIGERWKGQDLDTQLQVGRAAFLGRLLGTVGKLAAGLAMVAVLVVDLFA